MNERGISKIINYICLVMYALIHISANDLCLQIKTLEGLVEKKHIILAVGTGMYSSTFLFLLILRHFTNTKLIKKRSMQLV